MSKVFISHSSEDRDLSRKLAEFLLNDDVEVWIDYADLSGGDILSKNIGDSLKWCDTLILIWSKSASLSYWVKEEWTNAHSLRKRIIPCIMDDTEIPEILVNRIHIDFRNFRDGYLTLRKALKVKKTIEEVTVCCSSILKTVEKKFIISRSNINKLNDEIYKLISYDKNILNLNEFEEIVDLIHKYNNLSRKPGGAKKIVEFLKSCSLKTKISQFENKIRRFSL